MIELSIIIPTYNPGMERLGKTLKGLKNQTLPFSDWELVIIDNNSSNGFAEKTDIKWHPNARIVKQVKQGLTYARLTGFSESKGKVIIMVDDDNLLNENYLANTIDIFNSHLKLGAAGGKSLPLFEADPPHWLNGFYSSLALRDLGENSILNSWEFKYPTAAPIGAGMAIRKEALKSYIDKAAGGEYIISDRTGGSLSSGGDNDIVIEILKSGWLTGYFPSLVLRHIIPRERMQAAYLARLINNTNKSWIQLLESHGINPWPKIPGWSLWIRKAKAWFTYKAWKSEAEYIKWRGACGTFDGLASINRFYE